MRCRLPCRYLAIWLWLCGCSSDGLNSPATQQPDAGDPQASDCPATGCPRWVLDTASPTPETVNRDLAAAGDDGTTTVVPEVTVDQSPQELPPPPPQCQTATDCAPGYDCQNGQCVEAPTCEQLGTCPPPPGQGDIDVYPPEGLWFSYMHGSGAPISHGIQVYNVGSGPLILSQVELSSSSPPDLTLTNRPTTPYTLMPNDFVPIEVTFTELSTNPGQGTLVILSNDADEGEVRLPLVPQPKTQPPIPQPCIEVTPTSLNFGTVVRGQSNTLDFTIRSCGNAVLMVQEIKRGTGLFGMLPLSDEFQLTPPPVGQVLLANGQQYVQPVTFTAGLAGVKSGRFEVKNNDPTQASVFVEVNATAEAPPIETQGIHVQLDWDSDNCDVDLHLLRPGADLNDHPGDCYYANMEPDWGTSGDIIDNPFLDVDNVWGYGPENTNLQEPVPGTYKVVVYYYRDSYNDSSSTDTNATINVYFYGQLVGTYGPTYLQSTGWTWDVCTIDWPNQTITELGNVYQ